MDKNLNKFRVSQLTSMVARAQHEYESATEVTAVVDLLQEFMDMMNRLCLEVRFDAYTMNRASNEQIKSAA